MGQQRIIICREFGRTLTNVIRLTYHDRVYILTDENTHRFCKPMLERVPPLDTVPEVVIGAGDVNKNMDSLAKVWEMLSRKGASRHSLLINLGGGMVTDLGGFAAATFKRGITYVNVPTTLLSMVDAAVGGKTGINFCGLKNEIGAFAPAACVLIETDFLRTIDRPNLLSGYAEMLKHGLISTEHHLRELLAFDLEHVDYVALKALVAKSIAVKENIVRQDPHEHGLRKALNLGHTVGHAFESFALASGRPVLHGYAVAWGLVCELYLSALQVGFPEERLKQVVDFVRRHYGKLEFDGSHYAQLHELMTHDKKNTAGVINFTLLADVGDLRLNQTAEQEAIYQMFDFFCRQ